MINRKVIPMKKYISLGILILALIISFDIHAQDKKPSFHREVFNKNKDCTPLSELEVSDEQQVIITEKKLFYREQTMTDKVLLLAKRLEFERMLNNPDADKEELMNMVEKIGQLTGRMETLRLKLLIDIHQNLTPPQIEVWCHSTGISPDRGTARRPQKNTERDY